MKLRNSVNGNMPFEGDRTFRWQTIPANAKILSAVATVTPVDSGVGSGRFTELLSFTEGAGGFGATKAQGTAGSGPTVTSWVEVDFHNRRTLAAVTGSFGAGTGDAATHLQVDVGGGTYVELNQTGAFRTPSDPPDSFLVLTGNRSDLPGLTVAKLKATNKTASAPTLTTLMVRSVPTQVSLRVGELPAFWTHVGEMTLAETTSDFAAVLQTVLTTAKVENGFYDLPVTIHSDSIARVKIDLEIEFLAQQEVLPKAVPEVVLPFDASTLTKSKVAGLTIEVPFNSKVVAGQTSARVRGSFTETRIAFGPTGADNPTAAVEVSPAYSQSQIFEVGDKVSAISADREISAVAVDLLLEALTPSARLQLDIRGDFDGKPDEIPLLPAPVEFAIEQRPEKGGAWTSVQLPAEFLFAKAKDKPSRYWLLLQSLEGRAAWSVTEIPKKSRATTTSDKLLNAQRTSDGGLSWQDTSLISTSLRDKLATPPYVALFRLRDKPKTFKMPIKLQVGSGDKAVEKKLDRFEPLGRVDFTLDTELADGINEYLATSAAPFRETEHLLNADFEQWSRVGAEPIPQDSIPIRELADAVAFSPDGTVAYVLDQPGKDPKLLIVDVACKKEREVAIDLAPFDAPLALVISPDGTRAYATNGVSIRAVDLVANQTIGVPFDLGMERRELVITDLAISPDGRFLYAANLATITEVNPARTTNFNRVRVLDTAKLEQQLASGVDQDVQTIQPVSTGPLQTVSPPALAVSPDGTLLYLLIDPGAGTSGVVTRINTNTLAVQGADLPVGIAPSAIALSPNGKIAVVANTASNDVSIIDTATGSVVSVPVGPSPVDVAISADSSRAYVLLNQPDPLISVIDLSRNAVARNFGSIPGLTRRIMSFALAPAEDQIYIMLSGALEIASIQLGKRFPAEWQITSGDVRPICLPTPFHIAAVMNSPTLPTSFSQVVPVAESCGYEFSFWGIAVEPSTDEPPAIAEVLWLNDACGLLRTDSFPIEVLNIDGDAQPGEVLSGLGRGRTQETPLVLHRAPLQSPAGANQAEVRFSVSKDAGAVIDLVSLAATSELVANGDFQLQKDGQLVGWTLMPALTQNFTARAAQEGIQLLNPGGVRAELVQTIAAESEQPFTLQFQGKATATPPSETPRIELRWLDAGGVAMGEPTLLQILPTGVDTAGASGIVPSESTQVEIHVVVPTKTTLEVKRVSLRYPKTTTVPVKFISEAPGDMTVSDVRIAFEQIEPKAPPIGPGGLCNGTPPGSEPGTRGDSCYCHQCEEETLMMEATAVMTEAGRPATMGRCSTCKTEVVRAGGPVVIGGEALFPQPMSAPVMVTPAAVTRQLPESQAMRPAPQLTDIRGIGQARAKQLTAVGIDSVEKLAASTPERVAKIQFITKTIAAQIIEQAKSLI